MDFSQSLMSSERPKGLSDSEKLDYELVLEEEAYPFEERSIEIHEKNLELMDSGIYNAWIEKSLGKLAELMPGRYAKFEWSSGWIDSLDRYAYEAPRPARAAPARFAWSRAARPTASPATPIPPSACSASTTAPSS